MLNTNFEIEKTMGSKISIQDIDQKASDFAKANFMKQLKEHHQNLEKENKEFKDTMNQRAKEAWKLKELVDELRQAIEEPKELDDK